MENHCIRLPLRWISLQACIVPDEPVLIMHLGGLYKDSVFVLPEWKLHNRKSIVYCKGYVPMLAEPLHSTTLDVDVGVRSLTVLP